MSEQTNKVAQEWQEVPIGPAVPDQYTVTVMYPFEAYMDTDIDQTLVAITSEFSQYRTASGAGFGFRDIEWEDMDKEVADKLFAILEAELQKRFKTDEFTLEESSQDENAPLCDSCNLPIVDVVLWHEESASYLCRKCYELETNTL